jgi:hypothetical protein
MHIQGNRLIWGQSQVEQVDFPPSLPSSFSSLLSLFNFFLPLFLFFEGTVV